jgi:hypothetical protein
MTATYSNVGRRLRTLEALSGDGGDGGCERCSGLLVIISHAITGEHHSAKHHSATWNGVSISQEELLERRTEARCPRCGRGLNPDEAPVIRLGGQRGSL